MDFKGGMEVVAHARQIVLNVYLFSSAGKFIWRGMKMQQSEFILYAYTNLFIRITSKTLFG